MSEQRIIRIAGRVQGVMFRASAQRVARQLCISGFAKNEDDGSVLIVAEGRAAALDQLVAWCRKGPPRARVDRVDVTAGIASGYDGFTTD
jgi:acylphosphatase